MKFLFTLCVLVVSTLFAKSQTTKIIDSSVDFGAGTLTVFLSDSIPIQSAQIIIGSQPDSSNVSNQTFSLGTNLTEADNMLLVPLGSFAYGDYYFDVLVTVEGNTVEEMEFKSTYF